MINRVKTLTEQILIVIHVLIALAIVGLILLQQGKGADAGASFGGGSSQTLFGASGGGNVLTRATAILAALFFITSLSLAVVAKQKANNVSVTDEATLLESVAQEQAIIEQNIELAMPEDAAIDMAEPLDIINNIPE